jgi:leucyl-tRNA synthetase
MRDVGLLKFDEPFVNLLCQGMVLNHAFSHKPAEGGKEYFWEEELDVVRDEHRRILSAKRKSDGSPVEYELTTMSKSKSNGVDPQDLIEKYGADTARLYVMFTSPPEATLEWNDAGVDGSARFLRRFWAYGHAWSEAIQGAGALDAAKLAEPLKALRREVYGTLKQVDFDLKRIQYNTVVSGAMKILNALDGAPRGDAQAAAVVREGMSILIRVMNPVVPHITHAMWEELGYTKQYGDLLDAPWPQVDEAALKSDVLELMLQVSGKLRGSVNVPATASKEEIEKLAVESPIAQKFLEGKPPKKVIVVPGRLVNIVV